jgi:hypothetical protein
MARVFGHLDGVVAGEVYGWALDADQPDRAIEVVVHINGRPVAEVLAVYYRPDVAERLDFLGRHGFYVDLSPFAERAARAMIDVRLRSGPALEGAPIRAHLLPANRSSKPTLLFMHIPKTGGTAFREAVLGNYRQSAVGFLYPNAPGFPIRDLRELPLEQRRSLRLVVGHFQYGVHDCIPREYSYFTIVREPFGRIWSHYSYLVETRDPSAINIQHGTIRSLEEMLESKATVNLDNMMVRCFAGTDERVFPPGSINRQIFDLAKHNLESDFAFVGLQDRMDAAYRHLQLQHGWAGAVLPVMNRGSYSSGMCPESARTLIAHCNEWDFRLFDHILRAPGQRFRTAVV